MKVKPMIITEYLIGEKTYRDIRSALSEAYAQKGPTGVLEINDISFTL